MTLVACGVVIEVLGVKLGANRNTINRALHSLAASGVVALSSSKAGSVLRLVA